jgi:hypothetical protein
MLGTALVVWPARVGATAKMLDDQHRLPYWLEISDGNDVSRA